MERIGRIGRIDKYPSEASGCVRREVDDHIRSGHVEANGIPTRIGMRIERDHTLDALKLFAIFLVLWGHAIQRFLPSAYYDEPMYRVIYSFHMPLFMALVGYFATSLTRLSLREVLLKKGRQLLLPTVSFALFPVANSLIYTGWVNGDWHSAITESIRVEVSFFWFLKSAFVCSLLYYLSFHNIHKPLWAIIASLIVSQAISIFQVQQLYPPFLLGVWLRNNDGRILSCPWRWVAASGMIFLVLLLFWDASFWQTASFYEPIYWYRKTYRIVIGLAGTTFFFSLFKGMAAEWSACQRWFGRVGVYGQETLGIYMLQTFILEMALARYLDFGHLGFVTFNFIVAPVLSVAVLMVCLCIIALIRRSRVCSFLFLGAPLRK